ncbi:MAG: hypothetical protein JNM17_09060 [Archangium sp.]|nr:hypothetical protein [Archangium sp.]
MLALAVLSSASCATLNTANMSEPCRNLYNACLNACPAANARAPGAVPGNPAPYQPGRNPNGISTQENVARCVSDCNDTAKSCQ